MVCDLVLEKKNKRKRGRNYQLVFVWQHRVITAERPQFDKAASALARLGQLPLGCLTELFRPQVIVPGGIS